MLNIRAIKRLVALAALTVAFARHSQSLTDKPAIVENVKQHAKLHANYATSAKTSLVISLYRDNQAGLTAPQIAKIYEKNITERNKPSGGNALKVLQAGLSLLFY